MFYSDVINYLSSDNDVAATVSSYSDSLGSYPSIFADYAPEDAERPYITVRINSNKLPDSVIMESDVYIDYWDYNKSRVTADAAARAIVNRLDTVRLLGDVLTDIRFTLSSEGYISHSDPREIHHNSTFNTRAARSKWMRDTQ